MSEHFSGVLLSIMDYAGLLGVLMDTFFYGGQRLELLIMCMRTVISGFSKGAASST